MKIAFLGLGRMGSAIAGRLAASGAHELTVWNRTAEKAAPFRDRGVAFAGAPQEAVAGADLVVSCLFDDAAVEALFQPRSAVVAAMRSGAIHLGITTVSADCANRLQALHAANGTRYVAGPVLGRPDVAAAGELTELLAGDASAIAEIEPVCRLYAARIVPLPGPASAANNQKLCANFFLAAVVEAMGECFTLADCLGASREAQRLMFTQSFALPALKSYAERLYVRDADGSTGFSMTAGLKDLRLIRAAAEGANCPVEIADAIVAKMEDAIAEGMADKDWSSVQEITRKRAGLDARLGVA
jgi:3-hydroxyisobutyrate dehydrogenase-like beta-hydroxyacid dehydrogenase